MDQVLPTPPRSPAPSPEKKAVIKQEFSDSFLNSFQGDPFEDLFSLVNNEEENYFPRKRKFSEILSEREMDQFLRDLQSSSPLSHTHHPHNHPHSTTTTQSTTDLFDSSSNTLLDNLLMNLTTTPPPTRPQSPINIKSEPVDQHPDEHDEETLSDFLSTFTTNLDSYSFDNESYLLSPPLKRQKFDSFSDSELLNDCFLFTDDVKIEESNHSLEHLRAGLLNDHNYCSNNSEEEDADNVLIDGVEVNEQKLFNFDNIPKKTKILVPLKSLMKTLQQKSFLVSPLGPGKKVIRLTGAGESVKGVLQSTTLLSSTTTPPTNSSSPHPSHNNTKPTPLHNVRKRPHSNILLTKLQKLDDTDPQQQPPTTVSMPTKKKTKAHNNMERMRRIDLRNSFDNLKKLVPVLAKSPKCSKVEILRRAEEYVRGLRSVEKKLVKEEGMLRVRMQELKGRLGEM